MATLTIRAVQPERDAAGCAAIYAPYVEQTPISFEDRPPDSLEMEARIAHSVATHPWIVAEQGGDVVGYAYARRHRERAAYRWAADVSVYVASNRRGDGLGRSLYEELFTHLRRQNFLIACAGITLPNDASVHLHEALGFARVGVSPRIGWKAGAWHDVGWWQLELEPAPAGAPLEPLSPQ